MNNCPACNHLNDQNNTSCENCGSIMTAIYKTSVQNKEAVNHNKSGENIIIVKTAINNNEGANSTKVSNYSLLNEDQKKIEKHKNIMISIISVVSAIISAVCFTSLFTMKISNFETIFITCIACAMLAIVTGIITRKLIKKSGMENKVAFDISFAGIVIGYFIVAVPFFILIAVILIYIIVGDEHGIPNPYPYLWQTVTLFTIQAVTLIVFVCSIYFIIRKLRRL